MDRVELEALGREELVVEARRFGVKRPEVMTRVELVDEVLRLGTPNPVERKQVRGWLGVARDLLASAVELGLNLPDAAAMIRGDVRFEPLHPEQPPVATVTLAEIYGAQGHFDRALGMLDEVLEREADHEVARRLRARIVAERDAKRGRQRASTPSPEDVAKEPKPADDESDPVTLVPARPEVGTLSGPEPDHATLVPAGPELGALGDDEPDHVTLMPARPERSAFEEDEPDHVTLMPARPAVGQAPVDESDQVTLMPAPRPVVALTDDGSEHATLVPARGSAYGEDEPDALTLFPPRPHEPVSADASTEEVVPDASELPTNPPAAATVPDEPSSDAVLLARTSAGTASIYFELGAVALGGPVPVLRVVEHRSRAGGVERVERDLPLSERRGTTTVLDLESGSVLRAALGRKWDGRFRATAVAVELRLAGSGTELLWSPRPSVGYDALIGRSGLTATGS